MFNDSYAVKRFAELVSKFGIETTIETGTHFGIGALGASAVCKHVVTIEIEPTHRNQACENFLAAGYRERERGEMSYNERAFSKGGHWIFSYLGSSPEVMDWMLSKREFIGPFLFYLDAHWKEYWPLKDELSVIAKQGIHKCVIIIHDFKVPGKPWAYDSHGGQELNWEYVGGGVLSINPEFVISHNEEADGNTRGILYCTPR